MPFPIGWPPRPATGRRSLRFYVAGTATANFYDNAFLFRDANKALVVIGAGLNGRVIVSYNTLGVSGNSFFIQVVIPPTGGPNALAATLVGNMITVSLATDAANHLVPLSNTATLVAAAIGAIPGFAASATGTGATSLGGIEGPSQFHFGGGMPLIPTPYVRRGMPDRAVAGDTVIPGSPAGGGTNDQVATDLHHWCANIRILNIGGAALTYSFDGINNHGFIPATTTEVLLRERYEAGICISGTAAFRIEAW